MSPEVHGQRNGAVPVGNRRTASAFNRYEIVLGLQQFAPELRAQRREPGLRAQNRGCPMRDDKLKIQ
jgi:hypothetical protein